MYRLIKIESLKGYRFFQDFKWQSGACTPFDRYNIVYGPNGSGKTTLCDFLNGLAIAPREEMGAKMSLLFEDTATGSTASVTQNNLSTLPYDIRVFHHNYIRETIAQVDKVKHIFALGTGQQARIEDLKALKASQKREEVSLEVLRKQLSALEASLEQLKTAKASQIRIAANYPSSYNKNKFYRAYQNLDTASTLTDQEYRNALVEIRAERKAAIPAVMYNFIRPSVRESILGILSRTPVNTAIEALKNDGELNAWVENGLAIHENRGATVCQFCGNEISHVRLDALRAHFNRSYKELGEKIDAAINLLRTKIRQFETALAGLPNAAVFYIEFREEFERLHERIRALCAGNTAAIESIISILARKKGDMVSDKYIPEFEAAVGQIDFDYTPFDEITALIRRHNAKTEDFEKSIKEAQSKIERHMLGEFFSEISAAEDAIFEKQAEVKQKESALAGLKGEIHALDKTLRNSQIPAEAMTRDIALIMGRGELVFENKDFGYQITRNGELAQNLSTGEQNAIALIYFFNALMGIDVDIRSAIVVMDDPVAGFDPNFHFNAVNYIREKTSEAGQVFIFTHNVSLMKNASFLFSEEANRYALKRVGDAPALLDADSTNVN